MELKNNEKEIIFKDKYSMSLEENIFVAKRNLIDYIWKSANLEGIAVTYPQTEIISEGMAVNGMRINDINAIVNLKHAWQFTLENINYPLDFKFISQINKIIGDYNLILHSGEIRKSDVSMGTQPFYDGNKRTAMMAANQIMIQNGKGIISIPIEQQVTFREMLIDFYETDNMYRIKNFLYNNCIDGINF